MSLMILNITVSSIHFLSSPKRWVIPLQWKGWRWYCFGKSTFLLSYVKIDNLIASITNRPIIFVKLKRKLKRLPSAMIITNYTSFSLSTIYQNEFERQTILKWRKRHIFQFQLEQGDSLCKLFIPFHGTGLFLGFLMFPGGKKRPVPWKELNSIQLSKKVIESLKNRNHSADLTIRISCSLASFLYVVKMLQF